MPKPLKVPSLPRSVPKPLIVPSLARSVPKAFKMGQEEEGAKRHYSSPHEPLSLPTSYSPGQVGIAKWASLRLKSLASSGAGRLIMSFLRRGDTYKHGARKVIFNESSSSRDYQADFDYGLKLFTVIGVGSFFIS